MWEVDFNDDGMSLYFPAKSRPDAVSILKQALQQISFDDNDIVDIVDAQGDDIDDNTVLSTLRRDSNGEEYVRGLEYVSIKEHKDETYIVIRIIKGNKVIKKKYELANVVSELLSPSLSESKVNEVNTNKVKVPETKVSPYYKTS